FLPWFLNAFGSRMLALFTVQVTRAASQTPAQVIDPINHLNQYLPVLLWLALPLLIGYGLWRRKRGVALVSLWWFSILLAANPHWLGLPGAGALTNFAVLIAAYIPAAILVGGLLPGLARESALSIHLPFQRLWPLAASACLLAAALLGADLRRNDIQTDEYALVTHPDRQAFAWIATHTPTEARFLVNSFRAFVNARVGGDAGWWLPLLAGRDNSLPPLNYASESEPWPGYRQSLHTIPDALAAAGPDSEQVLALLTAEGITHIYVGQQQGQVNSAGPTLDPIALQASPYYQVIYHQDRVWIFAVQP
ncbi:MAG: hypothetical protein JW862_15210, partial [Anaerolineales bacterium]|nr:hypothetical protein [Anaerolineales bacterium]